MKKDILYSLGQAPSGELVHIADAEPNRSYLCPSCQQPFVQHRGSRKRPHFAHKVLSPNCTPETALHHGFKTLLFEKIQRHLVEGKPLPIAWDCPKCEGSHAGNLLKKAVSVAVEHSLGERQPDITLFDEHQRPVAAIEVVVSHAPEEEALAFYDANRIAVVTFKLTSDQDIHQLDADGLKPDTVSVCPNPRCSRCGEPMPKKRLLIIEGKCWKCNAPMKVAAIQGDMGYEPDFSPSDAKLAAQHGVFMKTQYSKIIRESYIANTCRRCNKFVGGHYLFTEYVATDYPRLELDAGYYCPDCQI
ncbi:competence protein CoiA family protein [Leptolyngbya sp. BL0902]|uniref:competence protein CoiA family protein n=1 Tax=Leptolyngbya sp. BL0902 TaxID=1115757 RepID=UPI0018E7AC51|nr:competence protein CoiA family protein [Leptolyngbya sp. BL0902]